jgi:hypothetical protein
MEKEVGGQETGGINSSVGYRVIFSDEVFGIPVYTVL